MDTFKKYLPNPCSKIAIILTALAHLAAGDEILAGSGRGVAGFDHGVHHCDAAAAELGRADIHEGAAVSRNAEVRVGGHMETIKQ